MTKKLLTILFALYTLGIYSQSDSEKLESLYKEVTISKCKNTNIDQALTEVNDLLKKGDLTGEQQMKGLMILANLHTFKGDRASAIKIAENAINIASKKKLDLWQARFLGFTSSEYRESNMTELGKERLTQAIAIAEKAPKNDELHRFNKNAYYELAFYDSKDNNYTEALINMKKSREAAKQIKEDDLRDFSFASSYQYTGVLYNHLQQPDSALIYLDKASDLIKNAKQLQSKTLLNYIYTAKGKSYLLKKDFSRSKNYFDRVTADSAYYKPIGLQHELYNNLTDYHQAAGNLDSLNFYKAKLDSLSTLITKSHSKAINTVTSRLKKNKKEEESSILYYLTIGILSSAGIGVWFYDKRRKKQNKNIPPVAAEPIFVPVKNKAPKNNEELKISENTQQRILEHIKDFEENKEYLNPQISATVLANQFHTNTKYLTYVLKKTYNKDFTTYINELRINHIARLLEEDPKYRQYKISYLAEVGGYSSHSKFTSMFKKVKDCSPSDFINALDEKED